MVRTPTFDAGEDVLSVDEETLKADPGGAGREQSERFPRAVCLHESGGQHGGQAPCAYRAGAVEKARRELPRQREIRLITVFFHDKPTEEESLLFVGHVGVLLCAEDGTLYFVKKVRSRSLTDRCALLTERR